MGFRSNSTLKRQLGTWHGRATGSTDRANTLEKAAKGCPTVAHSCAIGSMGRAKLLVLVLALKFCWFGYFCTGSS